MPTFFLFLWPFFPSFFPSFHFETKSWSVVLERLKLQSSNASFSTCPVSSGWEYRCDPLHRVCMFTLDFQILRVLNDTQALVNIHDHLDKFHQIGQG